MKSHTPARPGAMVAMLLLAAHCLNACTPHNQLSTRQNMTTLSPRLQQLFAQTKTICFGHFVLDVPSTAEVVFGPTAIDWPIHYYPGDGDKVELYVAKWLREVEKDRDYLHRGEEIAGKTSMFGKVVDGAMAGQKLIFGSNDHFSYSIRSIVPVGPDLYIQDASSSLSKDEEVGVLNTVARNLRLRASGEVPLEPGACIEGGFVSWQAQFERASLGVRLREFPDVHFSIEATKNQDYLVESSLLEPRLKRAEKDGGSWYARIKFLRRGPRKLGDWTGDEALARKPAKDNDTESHEFAFIGLGAPNNPLQPKLDIKLDTGVKDNHTAGTKPSLTDDEAVAVWDKLTSSIRVRPTGNDSHRKAEPSKVPLGSVVPTNGTCPQSGWWECTEPTNVAGGKRRHFMAGDVMPHVSSLIKPSLWGRLAGEPPLLEKTTEWALKKYDDGTSDAADSTEAETRCGKS